MTLTEDVEIDPKGFMQVRNMYMWTSNEWLGILLWEKLQWPWSCCTGTPREWYPLCLYRWKQPGDKHQSPPRRKSHVHFYSWVSYLFLSGTWLALLPLKPHCFLVSLQMTHFEGVTICCGLRCFSLVFAFFIVNPYCKYLLVCPCKGFVCCNHFLFLILTV